MLIPLHALVTQLGLKIRGILHVGAHECEEKDVYNQHGVLDERIYWVEALQEKVDICKSRYPNIRIHQAVIDDTDDHEATFHITNNIEQTNNAQSSSLLELGTHKVHHPHDVPVKSVKLITTRLDTLIERHAIPMTDINMLCLDIQGIELRALKSMPKYLDRIDYIYTEVNTQEVYKGCDLKPDMDAFLSQHGFVNIATQMWRNCGWGDAFYMRTKTHFTDSN